ncbi:integrase, catalytic region, zinc finger, CCHC-type containing protein [Tanacetum coccineum]
MSLSVAENVIVAGADNRPLMLDKTNYSSWASQPRTETTPATVRARTYTNLTDEEKFRESVDITTTNIVLQGSELSLQERDSKLYDDFDTFTSMPGETVHSQHEAHANEVRLERQRYPDQIALVANSPSCLNTAILCFIAILPISYTTTARNTATNPSVNKQGAPVQARVVKCYNYQEEGHFARQCTKPKRPKKSAWFKDKMLLSEALESGAYLDPKQLAFLADNGDTIIPTQASQEIPTPATFQTDDLDAFILIVMMFPRLRQFSWLIFLPMTQAFFQSYHFMTQT